MLRVVIVYFFRSVTLFVVGILKVTRLKLGRFPPPPKMKKSETKIYFPTWKIHNTMSSTVFGFREDGGEPTQLETGHF